MIALSEATLDLIRPWAESGVLPIFQRFFSEGTVGTLRSQIPTITPQMWGTIVTGKGPGHHGVFDFSQRGRDGIFRETSGSDIKGKPIWRLLSENEIHSGIVNVPFTYPPQPINGFMISGQDAPGAHRSIAHPPEVYDDIISRFGAYRFKDIFPGGRRKSDYLTLLEEDIPRQTDVLEFLVREKEWELFLTFFSATAMAQHYFWADMESEVERNPFRNVVQDAYRCLDTAIERLMIAAGPDTTTFVISECGAGPLRSGVHLNTWLEQEGFLTRNKLGNGLSKHRLLSMRWRRTLRAGSASVRMGLKRHLPQSIYFWMNKYLGGLKAWTQTSVTNSDIDWANTRVFSRGKEGELFVNLKGRDPHGVVTLGQEYEDVRDAVVERLSRLIDPGIGEHAVARVHKAEELYQGPMVALAPDLVIEWADDAYMPTEQDKESHSVFVTRWREDMSWPTTGSHRLDGILLAMGPGIRRGAKISGATIYDLMPTWLYALGQPIPGDLEGKVLSELFSDARVGRES